MTFSIDETNSYYQIDLEKKSISKIAAAPQKHSSNDLSEREEFISLLRNKLTGDRFTELVENLSTTDKENQLVIISAIKETQNRKAFPLIDLWATSTDDDVALGSIELLKELEIEESVPTLINLTGSSKSQISCAAIKAFEYFYWKDEAVPERKGWAVTELIQRLKTPDPAAIACAIDALAESESFRAVRPLVSLLKSDNNTIGMKAARALGMIRQTEAIPDLGPWK